MTTDLESLTARRPVILDGAMATMLSHGTPVDSLCLTHPCRVAAIHRAYIEAGADIIATDSFLTSDPATIGASVRIARGEADRAGRKVWVAGCLGPALGPEETRAKARRLIEAGADILMLESQLSTALVHALSGMAGEIPLMVSATPRADGTLQSGESLRDLARAAETAGAFSVGLNCGDGPEAMSEHLRCLRELTSLHVSCHPSAGLPGHTLGPEPMAAILAEIADEGLADIIGGCCGTTPAHIRALAQAVSKPEMP
ncbi:MAG: homocysteine S-methyltransferase family protein [Duncaniella sp.]|nr:homocysteine S-methyltransferase family protein [Duncaniella sp.]